MADEAVGALASCTRNCLPCRGAHAADENIYTQT
jgi:hypothetical protein